MPIVEIIVTVVVLIVVAIVIAVVIPWLKKKGITSDVISIIGDVLDSVPETVLGEKFAQFKGIVETAVNYAEQLYKVGDIPADKREEEAIKFSKELLKEIGIEPNDRVIEIVKAIIKATCQKLGPKDS